jgi:acetoacetyl-CoA synthetase
MNKPLWKPDSKEKTRLTNFLRSCGYNNADYSDFYRYSIEKSDDFWSKLWDWLNIIGEKGEKIIQNAEKMRDCRFFPDAYLNYAENCLQYYGTEDAIVFWGEDKVKIRMSRNALIAQVSQMQQFLKRQGVTKGDRVAGFVANTPEALIAMFATASLGAVWSSASPDFGVQGVLDRFGQIEPTVLIASQAYYYNGKVIDCAEKIKAFLPQLLTVRHTVIVPYAADKPLELDNATVWHEALSRHEPQEVMYERVAFDHPLFIMFSSGTTGIPKCIVHGHGGVLLTHMKEHQLHCDIREGDKVFYFTTCGWMMWNWQMTGLASGATLLLYDGSPFYPSPNILWDYADAEGMTLFGTAAKYIDALNKHHVKPKQTHKLDSLRTMTSTGSPLVHESFDYVYNDIKSDIHLASISGGTDIVSCFLIGNPISPVYRGEIQGAGLGYAMDVVDENGDSLPANMKGELVCTKPFPAMPIGFWNDEDGTRYHKAYFNRFDNIWCHGDFVETTDQGGWIIHGRSDATLNPGGVRIGTAEIYRQVEQIPQVKESIAIGQDWQDDVRIILFVIMKDGEELTNIIKDMIKHQIKNGASPRHVPAKILAVPDIPRTKSGKMTEIAVRDIMHGREIHNIEALANPETLEYFKDIKDLEV